MTTIGTSDITAYTFYYNGHNINLVDTPGFNDTHKSETEVLQDIATWLKEQYQQETKLNGIIYLHSLMNVRMEGSALRNLKMFRQLCGKEPLKNVILATTFWSKVPKDDALMRENELATTPLFWGDMLERGSVMKRLYDPQGALDIVGHLVSKPQITLQIQKELVEDNKALVDTAAGQAVNEELVRLTQKHQEDLERLQRELHEALEEHDLELQHILQQQQEHVDKEIEKVRRQQEQLSYDRRAAQRRAENNYNNYENSLAEMKKQFEERLVEERQAMWDNMDFDQAVAMIRAKEGKLPASEREQLEHQIAELSQQLSAATSAQGGKQKPARKKKGSSRILFRTLQVAFPATSLALLGFPIPSPFGSGATLSELWNSIVNGGDEGGEEGAQDYGV